MNTATLAQVTGAMRRLNAKIAPGSESNQWQAYVAQLGYVPTEDSPGWTKPLGQEFAAFWLAIAAEDYEAASRHGDVDAGWRLAAWE